MSQRSERIAVVVVHGMGNQFPMQTLREFVEALQPPGTVLYSSPNRITSDREVRRLSISTEPFDYYEYYWAHQMEEPAFTAILKWSCKLLFLQKPSASLQKHINLVRAVVILLPLLLAGLAALGYWLFKDELNTFFKMSVYGISVLVVLRFLWSLISATLVGGIQSSVGDVVKYTIPSPGNIAVRDTIRKNGIELLRKLHEAKKQDGVTPKYDKIILAGHSLGSIVAYDILSSLFAEYHGSYSNVPAVVAQPVLASLRAMYKQPDHTGNLYQNTQDNLFNEFKALGNQWRVHQFITMGSPLTHAAMLLNKKHADFIRKKDQREFPVSPPQLDHADDHFAFDNSFKTADGTTATVKMLHHAAHFAVTQWTNIYYKNDWVGGPVAPEFGNGVRDIELVAEDKTLRKAPLSTHTKYWVKQEPKALQVLKDVLQRSKV